MDIASMTLEQDRRISETVARERSRLRNFIRSRVPDPGDAEDILQDVFSELVEAVRMMVPLAEESGWLFRVAKNRIIDLFRKKKPEPLSESAWLSIEELLPSPDGGPEAAYTRGVLLVAHELQGRSFKELAAESGVPLNTLLTRKHTAVLRLRKRLQSIYEEFGK